MDWRLANCNGAGWASANDGNGLNRRHFGKIAQVTGGGLITEVDPTVFYRGQRELQTVSFIWTCSKSWVSFVSGLNEAEIYMGQEWCNLTPHLLA